MNRSKLRAAVTVGLVAVAAVALPLLGVHVAQECGAVGCPWWVDALGAATVAALAPSGIGAVVAAGVFGA